MQRNLLFIPLIALTFFSGQVLAVSPNPSPSLRPSASPTASPAPVDINEVTENLKKRLQESLDESSPSTPPISSHKAYVGIVKDVIKDTLIIEDKDGKKDIKLEDNTTILRTPGNATIKSDSIRIDDYIIAIGSMGANEVLTGRRLIVSADPIKPPTKTSGLGTIIKIGKSELTLKLPDKEQVMSLTAKTVFKSAGGSIELSDLAVGDTLIYTATSDAKENLSVTILMRILASSL